MTTPEARDGLTSSERQLEHRVVGPNARLSQRARDIARYHELLANLVRKELKVRYKNSALGFVWSMLNPALQLVIFWVVFTRFLGNSIPLFPIFFLSGVLGWTLFANSLGGAVGSVVGNASLVTKVYFPREVLPLSAVGSHLVHFGLQFLVLLAGVAVFRVRVSAEAFVLVPAALATEVLFIAGVALIVSVLNVYFRDVQHLLELLMLAWFWMTPIVYPISFALAKLPPGLARLYLLNPMAAVVLAYQRGVYGSVDARHVAAGGQHILADAPVSWYLTRLGFVALGGAVLMAAAWKVFRRLESRVAEEL